MGGRGQHQHDLAQAGLPAGVTAMPGGIGAVPNHRPDQAIDEGRLICAGDHHVRIYEEGAGPQVVVIIAGAGDCADSWIPVRHHLAAARRVVSYDRAAIGGSDEAAPERRSATWPSWTPSSMPPHRRTR